MYSAGMGYFLSSTSDGSSIYEVFDAWNMPNISTSGGILPPGLGDTDILI